MPNQPHIVQHEHTVGFRTNDEQVQRIELIDVENSPATRRMDLREINSLNLFIVRPKSDFLFMLDNVRLVRH